ncbi:MAG TPA: GNAT family protein [Candidatus Limnocylindrales bacterium]|jgi:RimJ/RimL family protein N-acetyltransferase|nr:GNAT family protein [Candidatus Limnocylindrales bacterium]
MTRRPEPVLRGRRTFLRAAERSDIPAMVPWLNDYGMSRFITTRAPMSVAQEERWFDGMLERQGTSGWFFIICRLGDDTPIGTLGLFEVDLTNGSAGIGISLGDPAITGQGLGTDALEALLDFGFGRLRLERLWLDVYDFNERAIRSYEKAGFVREGVARHGAYRDGRFVDVVAMAILRDEWAARRAAEPFPGPWPPAKPGTA